MMPNSMFRSTVFSLTMALTVAGLRILRRDPIAAESHGRSFYASSPTVRLPRTT
jgi:hypothetical protein